MWTHRSPWRLGLAGFTATIALFTGLLGLSIALSTGQLVQAATYLALALSMVGAAAWIIHYGGHRR